MASRSRRHRRVRQRERARLRVTILRLGGLLGWGPRDVIGFSEALAGRPWRRCGRPELEAVRDEYLVLVRAVRRKIARRSTRPAEPVASVAVGGHHAAAE